MADNPTGWIFGTACTAPTAPAPWLPPQPTTLHAAHSEQVTALPPGATSLASAPDTPHAAFGIGTHVATTQYHPEMSVEFASGLTSALNGHMPDDVLSRAAAAIGGPVDNDLWGDAIARFFETAHRDRAD